MRIIMGIIMWVAERVLRSLRIIIWHMHIPIRFPIMPPIMRLWPVSVWPDYVRCRVV